ncbi:hypothetical protein CM50_10465 [Bacillus subtilis]|nr:hypothetical protein CM50_10465 [Bacillus subtilis] [Bacillus stercoris]
MQVLKIFIVHVLSALTAAVVYVWGSDYDGYIPYFLISVILFIFYLIFAVTTDQKATIGFLMGYEIYLFGISFALIFWVWDSVFLQNKEKIAAK